MSATIGVHWPGCTQEEEYGHYGFHNDRAPWADFIVDAVTNHSVLRSLRALGSEALLSHTTEGMSDGDVMWVTPEALMQAANALNDAITVKDPRTKPILDAYKPGAIGADPPEIEMQVDLKDVALLGKYAREHGAKMVALSINW